MVSLPRRLPPLPIRILILLGCATAFSMPTVAQETASQQAPTAASVPADFGFVARKLEARGASPDFIAALRSRADRRAQDFQDRVIHTNVLGFRLKPNYSGHIDEIAIRKCRAFLGSHAKTFERAEKLHGVPRQVIAALLWVETRHGRMLGRFPISDVFLNLAMADHPEMIEGTLKELRKEVPETDLQYPLLAEKVRARSVQKAEWAVGELLALEELRSKHHLNPFRIKGSYAGAFGMPQFIPSSYLKWARGRTQSATSDLFNPRDAIQSVGNYLSAHGWGDTEALRKQALHAYNKSDAYVDTILALASKLDPSPSRHLAQDSR